MTDHLISKIYQDEPIIIAAEQLESYTPPKYRAMRKIAMSVGACHDSHEKLFYKQGKFMEDFEDDFDYQGEFIQYFPTYQSMNDRQLRGYFSWRTKVRRGVIEKTQLSFVFVYIYELINQIGVRSPEEGFYALKTFWTKYGEIDFRINRYLKLWLKDYVVYYNLDKSLYEDLYDKNFNNAILTLLNHKSHGADEVFSALNSLSSYKFEKSRFFKQHPDDARNITYAVFSALCDYYDINSKVSFCEKFLGKFYTSSYNMFNSAVFYDRIRRTDFVYEIDDFCKYTCKDGQWKSRSFFPYGGRKPQIKKLLKSIDFHMRQKYGFIYGLREVKTSKIMLGVINKTIDKYLEDKQGKIQPVIEIDVSKLDDIRNAALETQGKLLVEEEPEGAAALERSAPERHAPENAGGMPTFPARRPDGRANPESIANGSGLNDIEYRFLKCLLYGREYNDMVRSKGLPLSILVDSINEKLFDMFGDTVIIDGGGGPELVADYVEELKGIIGE